MFCFSTVDIFRCFHSRYKPTIKKTILNLLLTYLSSFHFMLIVLFHGNLSIILNVLKNISIYKYCLPKLIPKNEFSKFLLKNIPSIYKKLKIYPFHVLHSTYNGENVYNLFFTFIEINLTFNFR